MTTKSEPRFGLIITCVGIVYAAIVVGFKRAFGSLGEGAAGVALTTLATALYQKYRTNLPGKRDSGDKPFLSLPWRLIILLSFVCLDVEVSVGVLLGALHQLVPAVPTNLVYNIPLAIFVAVLSYFASGALIVAAIPAISILPLLWAVLLAHISNLLFPVLEDLAGGNLFDLRRSMQASAPLQVFCILYVSAAIVPLLLSRQRRAYRPDSGSLREGRPQR